MTFAQELELANQYIDGESVRALQKVYHLTTYRIEKILTEHGILLRSRSEAAQNAKQRARYTLPGYVPTLEEIDRAKIEIRIKNNARHKAKFGRYTSDGAPGIKVCKSLVTGYTPRGR